MGTRADFYIGRGPQAEWIGSIAYDGAPTGEPKPVLKASTEAEFRALVAALAETCEHFTDPAQGWPWPWKDSKLTDYSYAFDGGRVVATTYKLWEDGRALDFPDMSSRQKVTLGARSGLLVVRR